jgi:hypothetical protein
MQSLKAILVGIALITGITLTTVSSAQVTGTTSPQAKSCCSSECCTAGKKDHAHGAHVDQHDAKMVECSTDGPGCCKHGAKAEQQASTNAGDHSCCGDDCCGKEGGECATMHHVTSATQDDNADSCCAGSECCKGQSCGNSAGKDKKG